MNCTSTGCCPPSSHHSPQQQQLNDHPPVAALVDSHPSSPIQNNDIKQEIEVGMAVTTTEDGAQIPLSPTREQQEICLTACAPSNAHLSELDEAEEEREEDLDDVDNDDDIDEEEEDDDGGKFPYSSGSSPVIHHSFRLAVHQSRAPSTCGKFNESLLGSMAQDAERIKSTLCVCTSIRQHPRTATTSGMDEQQKQRDGGATAEVQDEEEQEQNGQLPTKERPITDEYKISHEVISNGEEEGGGWTLYSNNGSSSLLPPHRRQIIGVGESGKVMACFHKRSGEKFALKVLRNSARSRREIELHWRHCRHPHVVSIVDMFENTFDGLQCLLVVVEFMQGGDLLTLFEANGRNPYTERCVARIVKQIGTAVQFLHERNVAHRDIKLENILCSFSNVHQCTFKLADFGFAKQCDRPMDSPCCTPAYVCPEILSYKQYDKSCDIWALGVVTYILLCGYPPFYSMQGLPFSPGMRTRITAGLFAFPDEDWNGITPSTKHMISLMLKTEPSERINIQQLMSSVFLGTANQPKTAAKGPTLVTQSTLPPVPSDSSLSSDAGFESTDSKDTNNGSAQSAAAVEEQQPNNKNNEGGMEEENDDNECQNSNRPRAQFFVGSAYAPIFASSKSSNSATNKECRSNSMAGGGGRPALLPRDRAYSIQEQVDRALALMRMGGGGGSTTTTTMSLKNPSSKGGTGSKLLERRRSTAKTTTGTPQAVDKLEV